MKWKTPGGWRPGVLPISAVSSPEEMIPLAGEDGGKPKRRGCLRTLVVAAAVVVVLSMTAWFVLRPWLNRKVRAVVRHELATLGIHLSVGRTHLEPGRGMVFTNLTLYRNARRDIPVVEVSDVALDRPGVID